VKRRHDVSRLTFDVSLNFILMNKYIKISIISLIVVIALYNSFYFEKLDVKRERESIKDFNPREKAEYFWDNNLDEILQTAIDLKSFDRQLANDPQALIQQNGKAIGITSKYSFLVRGAAKRAVPDAEEISIDMPGGHVAYNLQIKYIFGNAARDAIGYFKIDEFENTMDFNAMSTELNKLILQREIVKLDSIQPGETIQFVGALEINSESIPSQIAIVPLKIEAVR
jgi:predicted lipoprotein